MTYTADARGSGISRNRPWDGGDGQHLNADRVESAVGDSFQSPLAPSPSGFPPNSPDPDGLWNQADYLDVANPGVDVPEPGTFVLLRVGMVVIGWNARRRRAT